MKFEGFRENKEKINMATDATELEKGARRLLMESREAVKGKQRSASLPIAKGKQDK